MGKWKVELQIRTVKNQPHMTSDLIRLLEWKPTNSKNGVWYFIRRDNISFKPNDTLQSQILIGHVFSALRTDLEVIVHGRYFRGEKRLVLNPTRNGGDL